MTALNQTRLNREDMHWGAEGDLVWLTAEELEAATAEYDLELRQKAKESLRTINVDIERALDQYHVNQDMEAMAARMDHLTEENAKLQQLLTNHKNWLRIANDQWSIADEKLTQYMVTAALTP
tara:strand:+ start:561 stop:929 length:369 start_codon:yes stop_codon:yes gene_type:complete